MGRGSFLPVFPFLCEPNRKIAILQPPTVDDHVLRAPPNARCTAPAPEKRSTLSRSWRNILIVHLSTGTLKPPLNNLSFWLYGFDTLVCSRRHSRCNANWDRSNAYDFAICAMCDMHACSKKLKSHRHFLIFWPNYCVLFQLYIPTTIFVTSFWTTQAQAPCHRAATTAELPMRSGVAIVALLRQAGRSGPLYPQGVQVSALEILKMQRLIETNSYVGTCRKPSTTIKCSMDHVWPWCVHWTSQFMQHFSAIVQHPRLQMCAFRTHFYMCKIDWT